MAIKTKNAVVSKKITDEIAQNAKRWEAFIIASGKPYEQLTPTWLDFYDAQSDPSTASSVLVELVDIAMTQDNPK